METYTLDAKDKALGRLATEIVSLLRGKNSPDFMPNKDSGNIIIVKNVSEAKFSGNKLANTTYFKHTGYLGSETFTPMQVIFDKDGGKELLRLAVYRMLPKNRMRDQQIKRLTFEK